MQTVTDNTLHRLWEGVPDPGLAVELSRLASAQEQLVEQQRIANLIALAALGGEEGHDGLRISTLRNGVTVQQLKPAVAQALGLTPTTETD